VEEREYGTPFSLAAAKATREEIMKTKIMAVLAVVLASFGGNVDAQTYDTNNEVVQTFAGSGFSGYLDGVGQLTMFNNPNAIVADSNSNLFVWDSSNSRIRKITPDGTVSTFAGGGSNSSLPATGTNALLSVIAGLTIDRNDNLWASGTHSSSAGLWKITSGAVVTFTNFSFTGSGYGTIGVCADTAGNIYFSTAGNQIYRYGTNGVLSVFAGSGNSGNADGNGIFTSFNSPKSLAADSANNIYVWDSGNYLIRRIDQSQNVTTLAGKYQNSSNVDGVGTNAAFGSISQMSVDGSGNVIFVGGFPGSSVRKMDASSNVVTMAGSFTQTGYTNGAGNLARFNNAGGVCIASGTIYVADTSNQRIRQISFNPQPQVVTGANLGIGTFAGVTIIGTVGRTYQVQSSPDLNAWTTRATILLTSSPYLWIDQNPIAGNKFYQALLLP
jgi:sugar lactone lactonase YvrE